jgi:hypothetical protein
MIQRKSRLLSASLALLAIVAACFRIQEPQEKRPVDGDQVPESAPNTESGSAPQTASQRLPLDGPKQFSIDFSMGAGPEHWGATLNADGRVVIDAPQRAYKSTLTLKNKRLYARPVGDDPLNLVFDQSDCQKISKWVDGLQLASAKKLIEAKDSYSALLFESADLEFRMPLLPSSNELEFLVAAKKSFESYFPLLQVPPTLTLANAPKIKTYLLDFWPKSDALVTRSEMNTAQFKKHLQGAINLKSINSQSEVSFFTNRLDFACDMAQNKIDFRASLGVEFEGADRTIDIDFDFNPGL